MNNLIAFEDFSVLQIRSLLVISLKFKFFIYQKLYKNKFSIVFFYFDTSYAHEQDETFKHYSIEFDCFKWRQINFEVENLRKIDICVVDVIFAYMF